MKYSKQRNLILDIVKKNEIHPTAEWVYSQAKEQMPSIGIATVYRNLNALVTLGDIERITMAGEVDRFDGHIDEHYHLKCTECGRLIDLKPKNTEDLDNLRKMINTTFDIGDNNINISTTLLKGVCNDCLRRQKNAN